MWDTKAVPYEPAQRFTGDWQKIVAPLVCQSWVEAQRSQNAELLSVVALSRMKALDYERKHRSEIPSGRYLLTKENPNKYDYYEAQIEAFLGVFGIEKEAAQAVLDSFKQPGTGGLHRQHVTVAATVNTALSAAAQFVSAQDLTVAAAIYGARMAMQVFTAERIWDSGWRRLYNSGTEDILPQGRADAAPSSKQAPTLFHAAHAVIWGLNSANKNLRKLKAAEERVRRATDALATDDSAQTRGEVEAAKEKLQIALARCWHDMAIKAAYKASSESAKIEFRGNQRYLGTSYTGTALTLVAGMFSILGPVLGLGAAAAPVTGGISAGVALLIMALYVGYQLSSGPSKDGEDKAKRAIVALSKSLDVLSADNMAHQKAGAEAYARYLEKMRAARWRIGSAKTKARDNAKNALLEELNELGPTGNDKPVLSPKQNWHAYRTYVDTLSELKASLNGEAFDNEKKALDDAYHDRHGNSFSTDTMARVWKTPLRIRMEIAERLLCGKVARLINRLNDMKANPLFKIPTAGNNQVLVEGVRLQLRTALRDMFNLRLALRHMQPLTAGITEAAADGNLMNLAVTAMAAIEDTDVHDLFCGDAKEQVAAADKAKKWTAGEAERVVYTNAGAAGLTVGLNVGVAGVDLGLGAAKAADAVHVGLYDENPEGKPRVPKVGDYRSAALSQGAAPLAAHMNAGNRAAFQQTQMPKALKITKRSKDAMIELRAAVTGNGLTYLANDGDDADKVNEWLDDLIEQIEQARTVPDKITLSMMPGSSHVSGPSSTPMAAVSDDVTCELHATTAYHRMRYNAAPLKEKVRDTKERAGMIGRHSLMALAGLPAQLIAQYNLSRSRAALNEVTDVGQEAAALIANSNASN